MEIGKLTGNSFAGVVRLIADAQKKTAGKGGPAFVELRVVNNPDYRSDDGLFIDIPLWGEKPMEIFAGMKKSDPAFVAGTLTIRYYDKKDGSKGFAFTLKNAQVTRMAKKEAAAPGLEEEAVDAGEDPTAGL